MRTLNPRRLQKLLLLIFVIGLPNFTHAASLNLKWNSNSESDLSFYSVYRGTSSRVYGNPIPVGKSTSYTLEGLQEGQKYFCAITATDTSGNESGLSLEVSATTPFSYAPPPSKDAATKNVDFNGDGQTDIFWHQNASGGNVAWHMNGTNQIGYSWLPKLYDTLWKSAGVGDFNQDGFVDILWRHSRSGQMVAWHMNGAKQIGHSWLPTVSDNLWEVGSIGDFDKNGSMDILWRHSVSGVNVVWHMNGTQHVDTTVLRTVPNPHWQIGGLGDFNQDGTIDILWHHSQSGENVVWHMDGTDQIGHSWLPKRSDPNWRDWKIAGVSDFDQDGSADILWRNYNSGENSIWLMNKTAKKSTKSLGKVSDPSWESKL